MKNIFVLLNFFEHSLLKYQYLSKKIHYILPLITLSRSNNKVTIEKLWQILIKFSYQHQDKISKTTIIVNDNATSNQFLE